MLSTITTNSNPIYLHSDRLNPKGSLIQVKNKKEEIEVIDGSKNLSSAATVEDLDTLLRERDWNIYPRKIISGEDLNITFEKFDKAVPDITKDIPKKKLTNLGSMKKEVTQINKLMSDLLGESNKDLYKKFELREKVIDLLQGQERYLRESTSIRTPFMERLANNYTNILDLNKFLEINPSTNEIISEIPLIKLGVAYTKQIEEQNIRGSHSILIDPVKRSSDKALNYINQEINLLNVIIEIYNGVIRVFPNSPNISECIILDCTLIYEYDQL